MLGVETSCDETALSIVDASMNGDTPVFTIISNIVRTQIDTHAKYGGVFPALAKREHAINLPLLLENLITSIVSLNGSSAHEPSPIAEETWNAIQKILEREPEVFTSLKNILPRLPKPHLDMIAVTSGPGLEPALWVGINFARALSLAWNIPMLGVNHMEGHIVSVLSESNTVQFPAVALLISGGHTELVSATSWGSYTILGQTRDDAAGEAFDKVARILSLGYPGGPAISKHADIERKRIAQGVASPHELHLPRPMISSGDFDFSFSGLKTAVLYAVRDYRANKKLSETDPLPEHFVDTLAYEFEEAVTETIIAKTKKAIEHTGAQSLVIGGGVAANIRIREALTHLAQELGTSIFLPTHDLATDNAVMIAMAGYLKAQRTPPSIAPELAADGNWKISQA